MKNSKGPVIAGLIVACLFLSTGKAFSQQDKVTVSDKNIYLTVESGPAWFNLPGLNSFSNSVNLVSYVFIRQSKNNEFEIHDAGFIGNIVMGFVLDKHSQKYLDLKNVRLEFNYIYGATNEKLNSLEALSASEYFDIIPINGDPSVGAIASSGQTVRTSVKGTLRINEAGVTLKADLPPLTDRTLGGIVPTISVGALISKVNVDYLVNQTRVAANAFNHVDEKLKVTYLGPYVGGAISIKPIENFNLSINADVAALYSRASLTADQYISIGNRHYDQDDKTDRWCTRVSSGVALDYDAGPVIIGIDGIISYWSYMPKIVNPRSGPGIDANAVRFDPTHIEEGKMTDSRIVFRIYVPFDN